jgi:hypothetical protein
VYKLSYQTLEEEQETIKKEKKPWQIKEPNTILRKKQKQLRKDKQTNSPICTPP